MKNLVDFILPMKIISQDCQLSHLNAWYKYPTKSACTTGKNNPYQLSRKIICYSYNKVASMESKIIVIFR